MPEHLHSAKRAELFCCCATAGGWGRSVVGTKGGLCPGQRPRAAAVVLPSMATCGGRYAASNAAENSSYSRACCGLHRISATNALAAPAPVRTMRTGFGTVEEKVIESPRR